MDISTLIFAILGSGVISGVVMHFLTKRNTDSITGANVGKTEAEIKKIEQDIETQYITQLEKWLVDLREIQEQHEIKLLSKEEEVVNLHKQHLNALKQLDESRLRLERTSRATQRLMSKADTPYWECDALGKLTYVNGAWLRLFGLSEEDALGNRWMSTFVSEYEKDAKLLWYSSIVDLNDKPLIIKVINPTTHKELALQFIYSNIHDVDGVIIKVIGVVITEHIG